MASNTEEGKLMVQELKRKKRTQYQKQYMANYRKKKKNEGIVVFESSTGRY